MVKNDDTLVSVHVDGELRNVVDNYSKSDDQNDCERHCPQKKKTNDKPSAQQNDFVAENKYQLGGIHDAGMGVDGGKSSNYNNEYQHIPLGRSIPIKAVAAFSFPA